MTAVLQGSFTAMDTLMSNEQSLGASIVMQEAMLASASDPSPCSYSWKKQQKMG